MARLMMLLVSLLWLFTFLGFGYIVMCFALKETGWIKTKGIVYAAIIKILAVLIFLLLLFNAGQMMGRMGQGGSMCPMGMKMDMGKGGMKGMHGNMMREKAMPCMPGNVEKKSK